MLNLALGEPERAVTGLLLVAPGEREHEVRAQLSRPAFGRVADLRERYPWYGELARHRDAMTRFGEGLKAIEAFARSLA